MKEKEDEIEAVKKIHKVETNQITADMKKEFQIKKERLNEALIAKSKQLVDHLNRDRGLRIKDHGPSRSKNKIKSDHYEGKYYKSKVKESKPSEAIQRFCKKVAQEDRAAQNLRKH